MNVLQLELEYRDVCLCVCADAHVSVCCVLCL